MDPGGLMNEGSFPNGSGNTAPYSLAEIWQFPGAMNGGGGGGLGLRRPQFGHSLGQFGDFTTTGPNRDVNGPDQSVVGVGNRKRRDSEDDLAKGVSTSNGGANAVVFAYFLFCYIWNSFQ